MQLNSEKTVPSFQFLLYILTGKELGIPQKPLKGVLGFPEVSTWEACGFPSLLTLYQYL